MTAETSTARGLVAKLAAHVRPTCSELWDEAQAFLAAEGAQAGEVEQRAREDSARLDALDAMILDSTERTLLLHHGLHKQREPSFCGLGLGNTGRTLRQAIDQARGKAGGEVKGG